jgi:transposase
MEDLSDFERGQIVGSRLAGASLIKTTTLLGVSRAAVSKVMSACTKHGKIISAKMNSGRKSALTERDRHTFRRMVSKNHCCSTGDRTAELNTDHEDIVSTNLYDVSFANPASMVGLQLLRLIAESNAQMSKRWCHDRKTRISDKSMAEI